MNKPGRLFAIILGFAALFSGALLQGQDVPSKLLSIPVYNPMVLNPAFVGSKDFTHISLTTKATNFTDGQLINMHTRLTDVNKEYTNFGIGAYVFQEQLNDSWNTGLALAGAYHFALDEHHLHNLSAGVTLKGILAFPKKETESVTDSAHTVFRPNMDVGLYYYGPSAFAGLSTTTLLGTDIKGDSSLLFSQIDRQYHLYGGYKFVISRSKGIVIEPSLLVSLTDETITDPLKQLVPYLKVYLQNFYVGTYLKDFDIFALFFQYQFPKFYTGVFLEFPRIGYLNDDNIIFEVSLGVNLGHGGSSFLQYRHW